MAAQITDFPSDPYGETGNLRKELVKILGKCESYPNKIKIVREVLAFAQKQLTAINKEKQSTLKNKE